MTSSSMGSSLGWSYAMDGGRHVVSSLILLVLAAILGPEAFGIMAMALAYVMFVELLVKQGLASAIIQRQDLRTAHLDSGFWLVVAISVFASVGSVVLAGWWAQVNGTPLLRWVIIGLTPMIAIQGLTVVQEALMRRALRFKSLALRTNAAAVAGGVVGVSLAIGGAGVWALVGQQLATAVTGLALLWTMSAWRPGLRFSSRAMRELFGFSSGSFLASLGMFVQSRGDVLVIGLLFGPLVVGLYRMAYRLVDMTVGVSVRAIRSIALPQLARVQDQPAAFRGKTLTLLWMSGLACAPALGVLIGVADPLLALLGEQWEPAAPALRLLAVAGLVHALLILTGPTLQALGRPHLGALLSWVSGVLGAVGLVLAGLLTAGGTVAVQLGALSASRALVYTLLLTALSFVLLHRFAAVSPGVVVRTVRPALLAGVSAGVVGAWTASLAHSWYPRPVTTLLAGGALSTAAAALVVLGLDSRLRRRLREFSAILRTRRSARSQSEAPLPAGAVSEGAEGG